MPEPRATALGFRIWVQAAPLLCLLSSCATDLDDAIAAGRGRAADDSSPSSPPSEAPRPDPTDRGSDSGGPPGTSLPIGENDGGPQSDGGNTGDGTGPVANDAGTADSPTPPSSMSDGAVPSTPSGAPASTDGAAPGPEPAPGPDPAPVPVLETTSPEAGEGSVSLDADLVLRFDLPVHACDGYVSLWEASTGNLVEELPTTSPRVSFHSDQMTVDWAASLQYSTEYYVTLDEGAVCTDDVTYPGFAEPADLPFTTSAPPPLTLTDTSPQDNAVDVAPDTMLVLHFSEQLVPGTGSVVLRNDDGTAVESFAVSSPQVTVDGTTLSMTPTASLAFSSKYYVTVAAGAVTSVAGAEFAGISDRFTFSFTTAGEPVAPLLLAATTPDDGTQNVPTSTSLMLRFGEPVRFGSGNLTLLETQSGEIVESAPVPDARFTVAGADVTFKPQAPLQAGTQYSVKVSPGSFESLQGAAFAGITDDAWSFVTAGSAPTCATDETESSDGVCFFYDPNPTTWSEARNACQARGSAWDLVTIRNAVQQSFAESLVSDETWLGATDVTTEGSWLWVTDDEQFWNGAASGSAVASAYTRWLDGDPTGGTQDCARLAYSMPDDAWYWADAQCDDTFGYLCSGPPH